MATKAQTLNNLILTREGGIMTGISILTSKPVSVIDIVMPPHKKKPSLHSLGSSLQP